MHALRSSQFVAAVIGAAALFAVALQIAAAPALWLHTSDRDARIGPYSLSYALILLVHLISLGVWVIVLLRRQRVADWLMRMPQFWSAALFTGVSASVLLLGLLPLPPQGFQALSASGLAALLILASTFGATRLPRFWCWLPLGLALTLLPPLLITVLTRMPFSPDEAHWADYATTLFVDGGIFARTWLQEPVRITPGLGWMVGVYGWLLQNVTLDIRIGRLWVFCFYLLAFAGVWALTRRLYGVEAAVLATTFAILSVALIPNFDYRPSHQMAAVTVWALYFIICARQATSQRRQALHMMAAGLLSTLGMQIHAVSAALAVSLSLFTLAAFSWDAHRASVRRALPRLLGFGAGALIGTLTHFIANVAPAGGLPTFLQALAGRAESWPLWPVYLSWPSLVEGGLLIASLGLLFWRRAPADRVLLSLIICVWLGLQLVDTEGYLAPVAALYPVALGAWALRWKTAPTPAWFGAAALAVTIVLMAQAARFVAWPVVLQPTSAAPYAY